MSIIYHWVTPKYWNTQKNNPIYYSPSFEEEQFIHSSTKEQLVATLKRYYALETEMLCLCIDSNLLEARLIFEWSKSVQQDFPHIYGGINQNAIIDIKSFQRDQFETWNILF